jgi:hypothetical protein
MYSINGQWISRKELALLLVFDRNKEITRKDFLVYKNCMS